MPYRGVSAVPATVSAALSDGARFGTDAGGTARDRRGFGSCSGCDAGPRAGPSLHAGPLLHFHPDRLQAESRRGRQVTQVLPKQMMFQLVNNRIKKGWMDILLLFFLYQHTYFKTCGFFKNTMSPESIKM